MHENLRAAQTKYWEQVRAGTRDSPASVRRKRKEAREERLAMVPQLDSEIEQKIKYLKLTGEELERHIVCNSHSAAITNKYMATKETLVAISTDINEECGVYFLILDGEIVYVGQSVCVWVRVRTHQNEGRIKFNRMAYVKCEKEKLNVLESLYIHCYQPKHNGSNMYQGKAAPLSLDQIATILLGDKNAIRQ